MKKQNQSFLRASIMLLAVLAVTTVGVYQSKSNMLTVSNKENSRILTDHCNGSVIENNSRVLTDHC